MAPSPKAVDKKATVAKGHSSLRRAGDCRGAQFGLQRQRGWERAVRIADPRQRDRVIGPSPAVNRHSDARAEIRSLRGGLKRSSGRLSKGG